MYKRDIDAAVETYIRGNDDIDRAISGLISYTRVPASDGP